MKMCEYVNNLIETYTLNLIVDQGILVYRPSNDNTSIMWVGTIYRLDTVIFPNKYKGSVKSLYLFDRNRNLTIKNMLNIPNPKIYIFFHSYFV